MNRRAFSKTLVETVGTYALFRTLFTSNAFASSIRPTTDQWLRELHDMAIDLKSGSISPLMWQEQIDSLYGRVEYSDLVTRIDFELLSRKFKYADVGVNTSSVRFPQLVGLPPRLAFTSKVFGMRRDRAIIPHGHRNMASCHYVLQGELHLRHYQKISEDAEAMVIEPTVDATVGPGTYSSISDEDNNVHWLTARSETAFTFDVIVLDIDGGEWEVDNIDPYAAESIGAGLIRAPKLDVEEALRKYGVDSHH